MLMHEIIILVAKYFIVLSAVGFLYVLYRIPRSEKVNFIILAVLGGILSLVIAKLASHFINDPRPFVQGHFTPWISHATDNGFPSDHTLLAAFLAWISLTKSRKIGGILLVVALLIGLARMAAGVHHSWDILGSFVIAAIGCLIAYYAVQLVAAPKTSGKSHTDKP